jgi:hypothetical protein
VPALAASSVRLDRSRPTPSAPDNCSMNAIPINVKRTDAELAPDPTRVLLRSFRRSVHNLSRFQSASLDLTVHRSEFRMRARALGVCRREISLKCAKRRRKRAPGLLCNIKFYRQ